MLRCVNDAGDRESDLISMRNLRLRNKDKRELQFGNRVVYLSPLLDSADGSSSYFSPLARVGQPISTKDDRNYLSALPPSSSRFVNASFLFAMQLYLLKGILLLLAQKYRNDDTAPEEAVHYDQTW